MKRAASGARKLKGQAVLPVARCRRVGGSSASTRRATQRRSRSGKVYRTLGAPAQRARGPPARCRTSPARMTSTDRTSSGLSLLVPRSQRALGQCGLRCLTTRCSGLATLAAELDIVSRRIIKRMSTPVLDDALRLPVPERIELVQAIWDSIVAESGSVAVTDEQRAEIDRRLSDAASNPTDERPWSEVRSSL